MAQRSLFDEDVCAGRHGGNTESAAAFSHGRAHHESDRRSILRLIEPAGEAGMTLDEASQAMDRPVNAISGRFTQLLAAGLIRRDGRKRRTRNGARAAVYVAVRGS